MLGRPNLDRATHRTYRPHEHPCGDWGVIRMRVRRGRRCYMLGQWHSHLATGEPSDRCIHPSWCGLRLYTRRESQGDMLGRRLAWTD